MEKLPSVLVGAPGGVKAEGQGARTKALELVATYDREGGQPLMESARPLVRALRWIRR